MSYTNRTWYTATETVQNYLQQRAGREIKSIAVVQLVGRGA